MLATTMPCVSGAVASCANAANANSSRKDAKNWANLQAGFIHTLHQCSVPNSSVYASPGTKVVRPEQVLRLPETGSIVCWFRFFVPFGGNFGLHLATSDLLHCFALTFCSLSLYDLRSTCIFSLLSRRGHRSSSGGNERWWYSSLRRGHCCSGSEGFRREFNQCPA